MRMPVRLLYVLGSGDAGLSVCQQWVEDFDCGGLDLSQTYDCEQITEFNSCGDLTPYFECLIDGTTCNSGVLDTSGAASRVDLLDC
jgi:hypothetical protein